jgi:hypothetical protein
MKSRVIAPLIALAAVAFLGIGWTVSASAAPTQQLARYTNDQLHFSLNVPADMKADVENRDYHQVIQFSNRGASRIFSVLAEPYTELDVGTGEEAPPGSATDQSTQLGIVTVFHEDNMSIAFHRNGIAYTVSSVQPDAQVWLLPILQNWQFTS